MATTATTAASTPSTTVTTTTTATATTATTATPTAATSAGATTRTAPDEAVRPPVAHLPAELRRGGRDDVPMLVTTPDRDEHRHLHDLRRILRPGDLLVVNDSPTLAAALELPRGHRVHVAGPAPGVRDAWLVEFRAADGHGTRPLATPPSPAARVVVQRPPVRPERATHVVVHAAWPVAARRSRFWIATFAGAQGRPVDVAALLERHGEPVRYDPATTPLPLADLQSVFAAPRATRAPIAGSFGSAEMPSASRPFTARFVGSLATRGVRFATVTLHTALSSMERGEGLLPEAVRVPATTLTAIERTRAAGGRVVAVGTTVVRALAEADRGRRPRPVLGTTDVVVTPADPPRLVDGLLSGFHEPTATHRDMLAAVVGPDVLDRAYRAAAAGPYLWHELGDLHLLLRR